MQNPEKTIKEVLEDNWTEWESLPKSEIDFVQGECSNPTMRFADHKVSIEVKKLIDPIMKRTLARSHHKEVIQVDVWILFEPRTEEAKVELTDEMQKIQDEVESILHENQRALTDIPFAFPRSWQPLNHLSPTEEDDSAYLRHVLYVVCRYEKP